MEENKITFEDIKKANESVNTIDVKGKDYVEVNQRVKAFRMVYPEGIIRTTMVSNENGVCIFKAEVFNGSYGLLATGTAYEKENSTFINKTSYIENCETSAVGRALGMAGFGIDTSIASAEEVQNAIVNQDKTKKTTKTTKAIPKQIEIIANGCGSEENIKKLCEQQEVNSLEELTIEQASTIIQKLNARKEQNE